MLEFNIDASLLASKLKNITHVIGKIDEKSSLSRLYMQCYANSVILSASSLSDKIVIELPCETIVQGAVYISATKFISLVQNLSNLINVKTTDKQLILTQNDLVVKLPISVSQAEATDGINTQQLFEDCCSINGSILLRALSVTSPFVDTRSNNSLKGVHIKFQDKQIVFMSCNGTTASYYYVNNNVSNDIKEFTIRTDTLKSISTIFNNEIIKISITSSLVKLEGNNCTFYACLLSGKYPPIENLIEKDKSCNFILSPKELDLCLKCISAISESTTNKIKLQCSESCLQINYNNNFIKQIDIQSIVSKEVLINLDYKLLQEAIKTLLSNECSFTITQSNKLHISDKDCLIILAPIL